MRESGSDTLHGIADPPHGEVKWNHGAFPHGEFSTKLMQPIRAVAHEQFVLAMLGISCSNETCPPKAPS